MVDSPTLATRTTHISHKDENLGRSTGWDRVEGGVCERHEDVLGLSSIERHRSKDSGLVTSRRLSLVAVEAVAAAGVCLASISQRRPPACAAHQEMVKGLTTRSPFLKFFTALPTS